MNIIKKSILIFLIGILSLGVVNKNVYAHYDTAYWNEEKVTQTRTGWMHRISDNKKLSELSIPGTHDSMAFKNDLFGSNITKTQSMTLEEQLISGIRAIDIRVKYTDDYLFDCYHGPVYLGYSFEDVLEVIQNFLKNNPTETVLMRLSQESSNINDYDMRSVFEKYYEKYKEIFYKGESDNPTMKEIRGKVVLLSNISSLYRYGINYSNISVQDNYHLNTTWDLYSKWESVKKHFEKSNNRNDDKIYMNYLSGSGYVFPYFVASGHSSPDTYGSALTTGLTEPGFSYIYPDFPRRNWFLCFATIYFEGTNTLTADYLKNNSISYSGIVMADFPGERLINNIIDCNYK